MAILKLRGWELMLIKAVGLPILSKIVEILKERAAETETKLDDALVGAFETVIMVLSNPEMFEET